MNTKYTILLLSICAYTTSAYTKEYSHKTDKQQLVFFGSLHLHNPQDPQYSQIKKSFQSFMQQSTNQKVILVEGTSNTLSPIDLEEEVIKKGADRDFASLLGLQQNIPAINADLNKQKQLHYLLRHYPLDDVYEWAKKLLTYMWKRFPKDNQPTFDDYVTSHLHTWFTGIDLTSLKDSSKNITPFDTIQSTILKKRQEHTFKMIQKYWDQGYDIFIVYGDDHALAHEQKIKTLLK